MNRARPLSPRTAAPNRRATTGIRNVVANARVMPSLLPPSPSPHSQRPSPETPAQGRPATTHRPPRGDQRRHPERRGQNQRDSPAHATPPAAPRSAAAAAAPRRSPRRTPPATAIALLPPAPTPGRPHGLFLLTGMLNAAVPPIATGLRASSHGKSRRARCRTPGMRCP